jgi:hypothetical protein
MATANSSILLLFFILESFGFRVFLLKRGENCGIMVKRRYENEINQHATPRQYQG